MGHGQVWNICLSVGKVQIQTVKHNNRDCWFEKKHKQTPCCLQQFRHEYQEAVNLHKKMKRPSGAQQRAWRSGLQPTFAVMYRPYIWEATDMCWYVSTLSKKFTPSDKKKAETEEGGLTFRDAVCSRPRECSWRVRVTEMRLNPESTYGKTNTVSVTPSHASHTQPTTT